MPALRVLRKKKDWSQEVLAKKAGISQSWLSSIEHGTKASEENTVKIFQALGVSLEEVDRLTVKAESPFSPRMRRKAKGFSREALAPQAGISLSTLIPMENKGVVSRKNAEKVFQVLGVSLEHIEELKINPCAVGSSPLREKRNWSQKNLYQALGVALEDVAKITIYSRADASLSFLRSRREKKGWS